MIASVIKKTYEKDKVIFGHRNRNGVAGNCGSIHKAANTGNCSGGCKRGVPPGAGGNRDIHYEQQESGFIKK